MEEYRDLFLAEAQEYLQNMTECLLELEKNPSDSERLTEMFRAAHSLKGMAGTMGYELITELTHDLENMLDHLRSGEIEVGRELVNLLFEAEDMIQVLVDNLDAQQSFAHEVESLKEKLKKWRDIKEEKGEKIQEIEVSPPLSLSGNKSMPATGECGAMVGDILNEFEKETLKDASFKGLSIYLIQVRLMANTLLKSVRAYMVVKAAESFGEIIKAVPGVQELEEENFDRDFSLFLLGNPELDALSLSLESIAEIEEVKISCLNVLDDLGIEVEEQVVTEKKATEQPHRLEGEYVVAGAPGIQTEKKKEEQGISQTVMKARASATLNRTTDKTVRVETAKLDSLVNLVGELIINRTRVVELGKRTTDELLEASLEQLERITTDLQNAVMTLRMIPIKQVFDRFPRMVRDLGVEKNKEVELHISGEETELDRTIVNQIGDPLVHLLRNAVDHGIEETAERVKQGKEAAGKVFLEAHHEGSHVVVSVEDDGAGIKPEVIKNKALVKKLITKEEAEQLTDEESIRLVFRSGFSTAEEVTDVSGRGVGMDVVKTSVEALNGTVEVKSEINKGSRFILRLPLTLAIIRALMVSSRGEIYAIPIEAIRENLFVEPHEIKTIRQDKVITLREEVLPIYSLEESLGMGQFPEQEVYPVVVVQAGEKKAGLVVDELMGQQEIVIKSLSSFIKDIKGVAGATVLGDGRVTLILDVASLLDDGRVNVGKESINYR